MPVNLPIEQAEPVPVIIDDDGSQDGMSAISYILQNPKFDVEAITVSQGLARPEIFGDNFMRMLTRLGITGIPVAIGSEEPLAGDNAFPEPFRTDSDNFWSPFVTLPDFALETIDERDAADLIIETVNNSEEPIAILATGPLTNIAEALRRDPTIVDNISVVQMMGGAVFVPGNLREHLDPVLSQNAVAEFNIWIDPVAAQEVFQAGSDGLPLYLTPLDATNQIEFTREDQEAWLEIGTPESVIAAEFLDFALTVIAGNDPLIPNRVWDLVAAINLSEPDFSSPTQLSIEIDTEGEPSGTQGQMVPVEDLPANVTGFLDPSFDNLEFATGEVFQAATSPVVSMTVDTENLAELDEDLAVLTFSLSEPAPAGGLAVNIGIADPDNSPGDTIFQPESIVNIADFSQELLDDYLVVTLVIAEGATEATFGLQAAVNDAETEGDGLFGIALLQDQAYSIDPENNIVSITTLRCSSNYCRR